MTIYSIIQEGVIEAVSQLYGLTVNAEQVNLSPTRKEVEGDFTVVVFPFTKAARKKPEEIGKEIGRFLVDRYQELAAFNVIKGFLNLTVEDGYWRNFLLQVSGERSYGKKAPTGRKVMVEFSSPNTNKPLHLGHIRNILLGWSISKILEACGNEVIKVQVVNDRGIAISKSMLAWKKFGAGATPENQGMKSDHFVGHYYVLFEQKFREEYETWQTTAQAQAIFEAKHKEDQSREAFFKAYKNTYFNQQSSLGQEAKAMLLNWESGDEETIALWKKMNNWVYQGFDVTYENLGVTFDKLYYESDTYLLGKDTVEKGLAEGVFYQKDDGSVWIDLTDAKLDHKLVLRSDGTSVYITQDLGTAELRYRDFGVEEMVYVVGDEQIYHFQVLFEILKRMKAPYADNLHHLSYGMVNLPGGARMKTREGTVVDADDLMAEVIEEAKSSSAERDTLSGVPPERQQEIIQQVALAALKFFIVKVQPQKTMVFDPKKSVDLTGQTGPYIQNAYVRIQSVLRKAELYKQEAAKEYTGLEQQEKELILQLYEYPQVVQTAADNYDPSEVANYCYGLAKNFHKFYHDLSILKAESEAAGAFRLLLSIAVSHVLRSGMELLGIEMPERM